MQQGILLSQGKDATHYQTRFAWKVVPADASFPINMERLQRAWGQVVDRHAILRTVFIESVSNSGYLDQVVLNSVPAQVVSISLTDGDPVVSLMRHPKFTYHVGQPPHRLLLCTTATETFCALEISHSLIDARSLQILQLDLRLGYDGKLPPGRGPSYSEYISYLQHIPSSSDESYWKTYLADIQPCLFPTLNQTHLQDDGGKQLRSCNMELSTCARLDEFCRIHDVTISNILQVAWGLVLRTYTGSSEVCFGYLNSGRDIPLLGAQGIVGPFINMLICRMEVGQDMTIASLLQKNNANYSRSLPHQHYPLAGMLHLTNMAGKPLFNTSISVQRFGIEENDEHTGINLQAVSAEDPTEVSPAPPVSACTRSDLKSDGKFSMTSQ